MKRALPVLALAGLVAAVQATNIMSLLRDTPAELFTARDYEFFDAALTKALAEAPQGAVVQWDNPETRASGSMTVVREQQHAGNDCKRLRIDNQANNRKGHSTLDFCRQADGRWMITPMGD